MQRGTSGIGSQIQQEPQQLFDHQGVTTNNNNAAIKLTEGLDIDKIVQNSAVTVSPIKKNNNNNNNLLQSQPLALQQQHRFGRIPRGSSKYSRRVHHSLARMCSQSHRLRSNPRSVARNSNRSKRKEASLLFRFGLPRLRERQCRK